MRLDLFGGNIGGFHSHRGWQFGEVRQKLVLGNFTTSSFHLGVIGENKIMGEAVVLGGERVHFGGFSL